MKRLNNVNITPQAIAGQRLPLGWEQRAHETGKNADAAYRHKIENAWRQPMSTRPADDANIMRSARLSDG
jgi:hypothetical protein